MMYDQFNEECVDQVVWAYITVSGWAMERRSRLGPTLLEELGES
jgi:hypothetical protein